MAECERLSGGVQARCCTPARSPAPSRSDIRDQLRFVDRAVREHEPRPATRPTRGCSARTARPCASTVAPAWSTRGVPSTSTSSVARHGSGICTPTPPAAPQPRPPATPAPAQPSTPPANTNTGGISHVMQWGETIWGLAVAYDAWPLSAWHTPSGDINRYYVGDVVTYGGGTAPRIVHRGLQGPPMGRHRVGFRHLPRLQRQPMHGTLRQHQRLLSR